MQTFISLTQKVCSQIYDEELFFRKRSLLYFRGRFCSTRKSYRVTCSLIFSSKWMKTYYGNIGFDKNEDCIGILELLSRLRHYVKNGMLSVKTPLGTRSRFNFSNNNANVCSSTAKQQVAHRAKRRNLDIARFQQKDFVVFQIKLKRLL